MSSLQLQTVAGKIVHVRTADFFYSLPPELIAQEPAPERDQSRLLVLHRDSHVLEHRRFRDLAAYLNKGDLLVMNDSKVICARLRAENRASRGRFEVLLLEENGLNDWWAMIRPGKRAPRDTQIRILTPQGNHSPIEAIVIGVNEAGHRRLKFTGTDDLNHVLEEIGQLPLPPYIDREALENDRQRYQTVYNREPGSVAAPTAGLHFTDTTLSALKNQGVETCYVTLHVGAGTFAPVKADSLSDHVMHEERFSISAEASRAISEAKQGNRRVIAVGTTSLRVLETAALRDRQLVAGSGRTRLFVHPPFSFQVVDALLTNFHLPCSTLLMLVSAFAAPGEMGGRELVLKTYAEAIRQQYRFFSYGDAMLLC